MKRELYTLPVTGFSTQDIEDLLSRTEAKGFPIVTPDSRQLIMGYIGRAELRYLIGKLQNTSYIYFNSDSTTFV
jgi:chloride channel 3/4/5